MRYQWYLIVYFVQLVPECLFIWPFILRRITQCFSHKDYGTETSWSLTTLHTDTNKEYSFSDILSSSLSVSVLQEMRPYRFSGRFPATDVFEKGFVVSLFVFSKNVIYFELPQCFYVLHSRVCGFVLVLVCFVGCCWDCFLFEHSLTLSRSFSYFW